MPSQPTLPFASEPIEEIPLPSTPLVGVIAQLRFPTVASLGNQDFIGKFQEMIRHSYPVLRQEREVSVVLTPTGIAQSPEPGVVWRFQDAESDWRLSLAPSFLSLDVKNYTSRSDFVHRFRFALEMLNEFISPVVFDRLGVRYVDRLPIHSEAERHQLRDLVRPDILGLNASNLGDALLERSICDTEIHLDDAVLHGRWGLVPPQTVLDALHGEPVNGPSWLLDLDMYTKSGPYPFAVDTLARLTDEFAERIYRFFRWSVKDQLLEEIGGAQL